MRRAASWLPPLAWMGVILWLSSAQFSAAETGGILLPLFGWLLPGIRPDDLDSLHGLARKGAHVTVYAVLAVLWFRALRRETTLGIRAVSVAVLAIAVGWALVDEAHQSRLPARTGSPWDVLLDAAGALAALVVLRTGWRRAAGAATSVLLWFAAAGGALALVLALAAGVGGGALWVSVPVAAAALVQRRRRAGRVRP